MEFLNGGLERVVGGGFRREWTRVCLWPIHVEYGRDHHNTIIILQLNKIFKMFKKMICNFKMMLVVVILIKGIIV